MSYLFKRKLIISFLVLFSFTCDDKVWDNPNDADTTLDPSDWAPNNLQAQVLNDSEIKLTWTQEDTRIDGFKIERKADMGNFTPIAEVASDATEYTDTELNYGTDYTYRIKAFTESNESGYSTSNTTNTIISPPTNLTATAIDSQSIQLTWSDNCSFEDGFRIERSEDGTTFAQIAEVTADIIKYTDTGLDHSIYSYTYRITAYTLTNQSDYSNTVDSPLNMVLDIDGNSYLTVLIGDQIWMAKNLSVTKYRNGDPISTGLNNYDWSTLTTGAYAIYMDDDSVVYPDYGNLYNWFSVNDSRNIAPEGWHVPSDDEWQTLVDYLGGSSVAGMKLKEAGTTHWDSPNAWATNESGFTALPGGYRDSNTGYYHLLGSYGYFWSSNESYGNNAWYRKLNYGSSDVDRNATIKRNGLSIRCVRD